MPASMRFTRKTHAQCEREKQIAEAHLAKALVRDYSWSGKSWLVRGELPSAPEPAHNERNLELRPSPARAISAEKFLAELGIAAKVAKGDKEGSHSPGQDNLSISRLPNGWHLCCVADGHGAYGHMISTHISRSLPAHLATCASTQEEFNAESVLLESCAATQEDIDRVHEESCQKFDGDLLACSGSTCVCLLRNPSADSIWVASVGDSKAIMFNRRGVLQMSKEHKVSDSRELKRIEEGCDIETKHHNCGSKGGETRIYLKGKDYPGLMMTRSFGDYCVKKAGVIATPDIVEWTVPSGNDSKECYVMIASDGIWDFITPKEAQALLSDLLFIESCSLQAAAEQLVANARAKWKKHKQTYCDDISVIIMPMAGKALPAFEPKQAFGCLPVEACACAVQ